MCKNRKLFVTVVLTLCMVFVGGQTFAAGRPVVVGTNGMVSTICPMASEAGVEILRLGGNAFDAYVGMSAVVGVTNPSHMSAGGGGWMLMYNKDEDKVLGLDHMGRMPYAATPEIFAAMDNPWTGNYKSALVVGNLGGWYELHEKYGILPLEQVWARAIDYAENGFPASEMYAAGISARLLAYPSTAKVYLPNGRPPKLGEICYNKDLANTYRQIIEHGIEWLYTGEGSEMIVKYYADNDGLITAEDLADFTADWWDAASIDYKGYQVFTAPPESSNSGFITLQTMKILENFDLQEWGLNSADYIHHMTEAFRLADADYYNLCITEERGGGPIPTDWLLSDEYALAQSKRINSTRATAVPAVEPYKAGSGNIAEGSLTIGMVAADKFGNLISGVQSAGQGHGTGIVIDGLGFTPTSMMQFADRNADYVWAIKGGLKVPIGQSPVIVMKDGKPFAGMGSGGTETIVQGPVQVILNMVEFGMNPQEAVEASRMAANGTWIDPPGQPGKFELHRSNTLIVEVANQITWQTALDLSNRGHSIMARDGLHASVGSYGLVVVDPESGTLLGAGDPRRPYYAIGW